MKKVALTLATALILTACGNTTGGTNNGNIFNTGSNMASGLVQMYVQNQCTTQLQSRQEWRLAALAMTQAQQTEWENKICGCVSEEAPNHITAAQLPQLMNESGRTQVLAEVTANTVTACYKRLFVR
ncbi:hypothetical protein ACKLNO_03085 [Neisseriaceae bacterium B1]